MNKFWNSMRLPWKLYIAAVVFAVVAALLSFGLVYAVEITD